MKTWVIEFREQDKATFERIKSGSKTIEARALGGPKSTKSYYDDIVVSDRINFLCEGRKILKEVSAVRKYQNLEDYLNKEDLENILGKGATKHSAKETLLGFPGYKERLTEFGIVAFEIK